METANIDHLGKYSSSLGGTDQPQTSSLDLDFQQELTTGRNPGELVPIHEQATLSTSPSSKTKGTADSLEMLS